MAVTLPLPVADIPLLLFARTVPAEIVVPPL